MISEIPPLLLPPLSSEDKVIFLVPWWELIKNKRIRMSENLKVGGRYRADKVSEQFPIIGDILLSSYTGLFT